MTEFVDSLIFQLPSMVIEEGRVLLSAEEAWENCASDVRQGWRITERFLWKWLGFGPLLFQSALCWIEKMGRHTSHAIRLK